MKTATATMTITIDKEQKLVDILERRIGVIKSKIEKIEKLKQKSKINQ